MNKDLPTRIRHFKATIESAEQQVNEFISSRTANEKRGTGDDMDRLADRMTNNSEKLDKQVDIALLDEIPEDILRAVLDED